jgi:hypothetical protein
LGGLKLYHLLDTQSSRYLSSASRTQEEQVTSFFEKFAAIGLSFPCFSPRSTRHLDLQSCTCPSPLYQPFDYHPPFVPLWLEPCPPTSCLLVFFLVKPCRISHQSTFSHNQLPTFGNFQHHFLNQRLSTNFIQPSRYPYPAIIRILRHLDFGRFCPCVVRLSTRNPP